ncbi:TauD/TfdA dioxygenase family protein [Pseudomonas typographi]|uniref:TauD/TfdA family dioxygenase n=1 Tax=Pseudomonas typographi TaxID=2715964 RepID=A0ABR7YYH2_9PSED|nr:TauD/TfdA family dioxygenase [Pseudomonas typographi]MBD1550764.1 TauD/TfdA family dioxygenase [Pseudomonas typographi]MBD1587706.1 TauD/TfdA family dioxygenase [Pseudomonas typographi]MBD1598229.1 TauD/TfdA family dioxygenase [Pseudomonas typographi]
MAINVQPVAGRIGAQIDGITLSGDLPPEQFEAVQQALLRHKVLFFRGQQLNDEEQERFSRLFGEQVPHPTVRSANNSTALLNLDSRESRANSWHTDVTFVANPPKISILRAVVVPPYGGDTVWANTAAAYDELPAPLKQLADNLRAVHSNLYDYVPPQHAAQAALKRYREEFTALEYETEHPVVHVHPQTGERALVLGHFVKHFVGLSPNDSKQLFRLFHDRVTHLNNTVRWRWQAGDVAIWDNRATQHIAINDYGDAERIVRRTTLDGDILLGVDGQPSRAIKPDAHTRSPRTEADKKHLAA